MPVCVLIFVCFVCFVLFFYVDFILQYEEQVRELKERIEKTRKQAMQKHKRKDNLQSKGVHILAAIKGTEEQTNTLKYADNTYRVLTSGGVSASPPCVLQYLLYVHILRLLLIT